MVASKKGTGKARSSPVADAPGSPGSFPKNGAKSPRPAWLLGDPEWESMKARCRNISHQEGVRESAFLSNRYRGMFSAMAAFKVDLDAILDALSRKKVPFVLTGAYGIAGWTGRPRATHDVDILVR